MIVMATAMASTGSAVPPKFCPARCAAAKLELKARAEQPRFRVIVTSDLEIDDVASFHRLLLYANDFADSLAGIVYSSSNFRYSGDPDARPPVPAKRWDGVEDFPAGVKRLGTFEDIIGGTGHFGAAGGYRAAWANLRRHDARYPSPELLLSLVKVGNITNVGEMARDTDGSRLIRDELLKTDGIPLWLLAWGGTNTIAAALRSIHDKYSRSPDWPRIRASVARKARLYLVLDQDAAYMDYIRPNWPDIMVVINRQQWLPLSYSFLRRGPVGGDNVARSVDALLSAAATAPLLTGALMSGYPRGPAYFEKMPGAFVAEGDTPSFLYLLPTGLESPDNPTFGGWGGRFLRAGARSWSDNPSYLAEGRWVEPRQWFDGLKNSPADARWARDSGADEPGERIARTHPQARWVSAIQRDLAARVAWQTESWESANHPPVTFVEPRQRAIAVLPGQIVTLRAQAVDPDSQTLRNRWWQYPEAGTFDGLLRIDHAETLSPRITVPKEAENGDTIHIILETTDSGTPPLTRYQRVVLRVRSTNSTHRSCAIRQARPGPTCAA